MKITESAQKNEDFFFCFWLWLEVLSFLIKSVGVGSTHNLWLKSKKFPYIDIFKLPSSVRTISKMHNQTIRFCFSGGNMKWMLESKFIVQLQFQTERCLSTCFTFHSKHINQHLVAFVVVVVIVDCF